MKWLCCPCFHFVDAGIFFGLECDIRHLNSLYLIVCFYGRNLILFVILIIGILVFLYISNISIHLHVIFSCYKNYCIQNRELTYERNREKQNPLKNAKRQNWKCCRLGLIEPIHGRYWKVQVTVHASKHSQAEFNI
jgi:hypothetical protein